MHTLTIQPRSRITGTRAQLLCYSRQTVPQLEIRQESGQQLKIRGYAAVFNQYSEPLPFREKVLPGAFKNSLSSDVRALVAHDTSKILGRSKNRTLQLREDDHGLFIEITPPDTTLGRDTTESVRRGDLDQGSFGFRTVADRWSHEGQEVVRALVEVDLFEVSLVAFPAYKQTSVNVRSFARELLQELEQSFGVLSIQSRDDKVVSLEYSDRLREEVPPIELKQAGVREVRRNFKTCTQTVVFIDGRLEVRAMPTREAGKLESKLPLVANQTSLTSASKNLMTPMERVIELESRLGIKPATQRQKREVEVRKNFPKTPREIVESLERRFGLEPSRVQALSDSEFALYQDPIIRRPDDYEERLRLRDIQKFQERKSEVANLKERWEAMKRARSLPTYIAKQIA